MFAWPFVCTIHHPWRGKQSTAAPSNHHGLRTRFTFQKESSFVLHTVLKACAEFRGPDVCLKNVLAFLRHIVIWHYWDCILIPDSHFAIILRAHDQRLTEDMFITVLHGENKAGIFNIRCKVQLLLDCVKSHCGCEEAGEIELADETGQIKNLLLNRHRCAAEILGERETYVPLSVTRGGNSSEVEFTPLLQDDSVVNQKFLAKLGSWQDPKAPSPRVKSRKTHHKKSALDIPVVDGLRNHSPHAVRTRTPITSPRQSRKF